MEILRYLDPKGKLATYHSIFIQVGIIQSSPPSAPDNSILSHKSLWESFAFCWFQPFQSAKRLKVLGYLHHLQVPKTTYPRLKSKSFPPAIQLVAGKKKTHGSPGRPCRPFCDVVDGICLRSIGAAVVARTTPIPQKKEKWGGKKYVLEKKQISKNKTP